MCVASKIKIGILFLFTPFFLIGQNVLPPIYNYKLSEYKGGSKNWDLAINKEGELFAANNEGLLYFNGEDWSLNKLPNSTVIRSVAVVGDSIYTGSYEEFGYWKKNGLGKLRYTSLTHLIKSHSFTSEEFWEIKEIDNAIVFRSVPSIYILRAGKIEVVNPPEIISDLISYKNRIIVAAKGKGLYELVEGKLLRFKEQQYLIDKNITDMIHLKNGILVGTKLNGCYFFDGKRIKPWEASINDDLKAHQLNKMVNLGNGKIAFGTIKNGMYIFNGSTNSAQVFNGITGLQNNTILSMLQNQNQLWLGLDNGLTRIKLDNPITYYTDFTGVLGTVYDLAQYDDKLYLGSNTGVFYFEDNKLDFLEGTQGHVWDLELIEGDLFIGHNAGTYQVKKNVLKKISSFTGGYQIRKIPESLSSYIQGTYNGLVSFKKVNNNKWDSERIKGLDFPAKQICFETPHILWVVNPYKSFFRVHLNDDYSKVIQIQEFNGANLPNKYDVQISNIKNNIVFSSKGSWFKYDPLGDRIVPFNDFKKYNGNELLFFDDSRFWFVHEPGKKELIYTDLRKDSLLITDSQLRERLVPDAKRMVKSTDSTTLITLSDGFAKINSAALVRQSKKTQLPVPKLDILQDEKNTFAISPIAEVIRVPYNNSQHIGITVTSPELIQPRYQYHLYGPKEYGEIVESGHIKFQNLPYGDYSFEVATVGIDNKTSEKQILNFEISPPWYLSWISFLGYLILIVLGILMVRRYNQHKLRRKQINLEKQLIKQQQDKFAKLEKEKLAQVIKLKQNELANTTLNLAKKNEIILELKNLLLMNKDKFPNSQHYRSFMKKLDSSVNDTEDWKRFEINFKELHQDFFERLLKSYPSLTSKDLKLCAYLKMNLSTKEISPLMGISVRGIEIHRYRLRKKLALDGMENLSNFLITF